MNNYENTYVQWHRYLNEQARYDFEPGSPTNKLPREVKDAVEKMVTDWANEIVEQQVENQEISPKLADDLIRFKQESLGTYDRTTWLYFHTEDQRFTPIPIGTEEFIELWNKQALVMKTWNGDYPTGQPPAAELAMGKLWVQTIVNAIERKLGQEIDVPMAVETIPELDFEDLGVSNEEELSQIDLSDFDLNSLGVDNPEPQEMPAIPSPPIDVDPESDSEVAAEPEPDEPVEPEDFDKIVAGINSISYPDSLLNMLKNVDISGAQKRQLLSLLLQATEQDDIVLEAIGEPQRAPRTFSPETTQKLNDLLKSFGLDPRSQQNLEKVINKWAKLNTVKFSKAPPPPETSPETALDDEEGEDEVTDAPAAEEDEEGETESGEDTEEKEELSTLGKVELGIEAALNTVSAAGVIPFLEATLIPSAATLASLVFNLARGKMSAALLDIVALAPVVGKASKLGKLGPIGAKIAAKVGPASFKGGRLLIKTFGSAKNARAAITTMKSAKAAKDLAKAGSATKELIENVPEEWITAAIYKKQDDGDYWIDTVLGGVATLSSLPGIPDGIGTAADELNQSVESLRRAIPPPKEPAPDPTDLPEPGMDPSELAETLDRWQTLAGINKRIL